METILFIWSLFCALATSDFNEFFSVSLKLTIVSIVSFAFAFKIASSIFATLFSLSSPLINFSTSIFSLALTIDNALFLSSFIFEIKLFNFAYSSLDWAFVDSFSISDFKVFLAVCASFEFGFG
ncbi:hypothetical protein NW069_03370 [Mycoplasmopsis cynos]|uniref:hypothetical protein n=1 Tax=Mycoplasmopsis cynos TaxID=171284 RepID=UPI002207028C|nr:hypothetical protein [Mycoplasmopsis cynos]UWV80357.1 hypothetical protein NW069_03370 [Mycoplasmopsis cynos]